MKVILALEGLRESDIKRIYESEKLNEKIKSKKRKGENVFVQTHDIVYLQTALIQIKDFHSHSLKNINKSMREFRDFKLKALIKAILSAHEELALVFSKRYNAESDQYEPVTNIHGNIKSSNIFIENAG